MFSVLVRKNRPFELKMASDKNKCADRKKTKDWRISSVRNETSHSGMSLDENLTANRNNPKASGVPKFLRTQSSSVILPSPRKSRSATRFLGSLMHTSVSDSFGSKSSIRDKNSNYSSLNNLARLMSPSNRNTASSLNHSKSLRSVDHIIDENTELRTSSSNLDEDNTDDNFSIRNSSEFSANSSRSSSRLSRYRMQHFRRRSISWDSAENAKAFFR